MKTNVSYTVEVLDKKTKVWEAVRCVVSAETAEKELEKLMADRMKSVVPYDPWTKARILEVVTEYKVHKEITPEF
jgi:hypothetical protein